MGRFDGMLPRDGQRIIPSVDDDFVLRQLIEIIVT